MRVWIIRQYTDPVSHYVLWSEEQALRMLDENEPDPSGWGKMTLYAGEVQEVETR